VVFKAGDPRYTAVEQIAALDDNTDAQLVETALSRNIEILLATSAKDIGLVDAEGWLDRYRDVLDETLLTLNLQRGAQERVSLKLLVEELCNLWESETGLPAAAHGVVKDAYTSRVETDAGRFVTVAVEAMLPDKTWFVREDETRWRFGLPGACEHW
jgi:hypothetical protein